jgi:hypothetical protein
MVHFLITCADYDSGMRMAKRFVCIFLVLFLLLASCQTRPSRLEPAQLVVAPPWKYIDLRLIKTQVELTPSQSLAALYVRDVGGEQQIRLDLLDYSPDPIIDLYLALDTRPGGTRYLPLSAQANLDWDALITIPASGDVTVIDAQGKEIPGLKLRVVQDAIQDSVVVSLDRAALGVSRTGFGLQVLLTAAKSQEISDSLGPIRSDAPSPIPAPVLLAFWNTFPATSPAQALRSWNGAHTGPFGGRHGLANLLNAALADKIPLTLLDIKTPTSLSALNTVGNGLGLVKSMSTENLLSLPDVLPVEASQSGNLFQPTDWVLQKLVIEERRTAGSFQLPAEPYLYSPLLPPDLPTQALSVYKLLFTNSDGNEGPSGTGLICQRYQSWLVLPLPTGLPSDLSASQVKAEQQVSLNGLSIDARRALLSLALYNAASGANFLNPCSGKILLLGGNLAYSAWGEPFIAQAAMDYIAGHPWIRVLKPEDLLGVQPAASMHGQDFVPAQRTFNAGSIGGSLGSPQSTLHGPDGKPIVSELTIAQLHAYLLEDLHTAPPGPLAEDAWQMYTSLIAPDFSPSPGLYPLRAAYLGQVGIWLAADRWAANPDGICVKEGGGPCAYVEDLNWDGESEYILASSGYFTVFEARGGYLAAAFSVDKNGPHQMVGPSWQFIVGLADPSVWNADLGIAGDPRALRGAFSEIPAGYAAPSWETYSIQIGQGELQFTSPDGRLHKAFRLSDVGITARYDSLDQVKVQIPLTIDPWNRFSPNWEESYISPEDGSISNLRDWSWGVQGKAQIGLSVIGANMGVQPFTITQNLMRSPENPDFQNPTGHYLPFPMALGEIDGEGNFTIILGMVPDK